MSAILDFQKYKILTVVAVCMVNWSTCFTLPNFMPIGQTVTAEMLMILQFFKMAAIYHLEFDIRVCGPPRKSTWWSLSHCKICLELVQ